MKKEMIVVCRYVICGAENVRCEPAIEAVMKHATLPATIALSAKQAKSDRRDGASALSAPSWIATDPKLLKPHSAYVAINCERYCNTSHNDMAVDPGTPSNDNMHTTGCGIKNNPLRKIQ